MIEREMEDLLAAYTVEFFPRQILNLIGRQKSFHEVGRFDLLFEDQFKTTILMELKARTARYEDATQLAKYKDALEQQGLPGVLMWLVATHVPSSVREFLSRIGIEYSEIHETEFRLVARRHGYEIASEAQRTRAAAADTSSAITGTSLSRKMDETLLPFSRNRASAKQGFLERCNERGKEFFGDLFARQEKLSSLTRITWNHESGFSLQFNFPTIGFVAMVWGFPGANLKGMQRPQRVRFPFHFAAKRIPTDFLIQFAADISKVVSLSGHSKPGFTVDEISSEQGQQVLDKIFTWAERAQGPTSGKNN